MDEKFHIEAVKCVFLCSHLFLFVDFFVALSDVSLPTNTGREKRTGILLLLGFSFRLVCAPTSADGMGLTFLSSLLLLLVLLLRHMLHGLTIENKQMKFTHYIELVQIKQYRARVKI